MTETDLIVFLEWLDAERVVVQWENTTDTHSDVALRYLAERARYGSLG